MFACEDDGEKGEEEEEEEEEGGRRSMKGRVYMRCNAYARSVQGKDAFSSKQAAGRRVEVLQREGRSRSRALVLTPLPLFALLFMSLVTLLAACFVVGAMRR